MTLFYQTLYAEKANATSRYVCEHGQENSGFFTTFYISGNYLMMSGASGRGQYSITYYEENEGIIAINSSEIGDASGSEVIFINLKNLTFSYSSIINQSDSPQKIDITGRCK